MITLDGYSMDYFGLIQQPGHKHPGLPPTVSVTAQIPYRNGLIDYGAYLSARPFSFPMAWARETNRADLQTKIRTFAAFLLDTKGKPRNMVLRFNYDTDKYYTVKLDGQFDLTRDLNLAFFTLPLIAYDPYAYGSEQIVEVTATSNNYHVSRTTNGTVNSDTVITVTNTGVGTIHGFTITSEILIN